MFLFFYISYLFTIHSLAAHVVTRSPREPSCFNTKEPSGTPIPSASTAQPARQRSSESHFFPKTNTSSALFSARKNCWRHKGHVIGQRLSVVPPVGERQLRNMYITGDDDVDSCWKYEFFFTSKNAGFKLGVSMSQIEFDFIPDYSSFGHL